MCQIILPIIWSQTTKLPTLWAPAQRNLLPRTSWPEAISKSAFPKLVHIANCWATEFAQLINIYIVLEEIKLYEGKNVNRRVFGVLFPTAGNTLLITKLFVWWK